MPMQRDFRKYHESIASELRAVKDRIRNLIGGRHWQSDGEHKEAVLRRVLRSHLAQSLEVGRGFVCTEHDTSTQIDILITRRNKPTLFREGETLLVTPDAVACLIEVKTRIDDNLENVLSKLADNAKIVRAANRSCVVGLFVYEPFEHQDPHRELLTHVHAASRGDDKRVVNWIAAGPNLLVRYWERGSAVCSPVEGSVWHSYELNNLSHAYFLSNVVWETCPDLDRQMQYAWFPVEGGKERFRCCYIPLSGGEVKRFDDGRDR